METKYNDALIKMLISLESVYIIIQTQPKDFSHKNGKDLLLELLDQILMICNTSNLFRDISISLNIETL